MVDNFNLKYKLIATVPNGTCYNLTDVAEEITWQEYEDEFSSRITFSLYNARLTSGQWISEVLKPNSTVVVYANWGEGYTEVARGILNRWKASEDNKENVLDCEANDRLFALEKSQEHRYVSKGQTARAVINSICSDWGLTIGTNQAPEVELDKEYYKGKYVGDIVADTLKSAKKKGGEKCFIRAREDVVDIIPRGTNSEVYTLKSAENVTNVSGDINVQDIVTRVAIYSSASDDEKSSIVSVVDGHTEYGIRQRVITQGSEEDISEAKESAAEILEDDGEPDLCFKIKNAPDVPQMRKGDSVHIHAGSCDGMYYVTSIIHYAYKKTMTIEVESTDS